MGCGVTAFGEDDALRISKENVFSSHRFPEITKTLRDVDIQSWIQAMYVLIWVTLLGAAFGFHWDIHTTDDGSQASILAGKGTLACDVFGLPRSTGT